MGGQGAPLDRLHLEQQADPGRGWTTWWFSMRPLRSAPWHAWQPARRRRWMRKLCASIARRECRAWDGRRAGRRSDRSRGRSAGRWPAKVRIEHCLRTDYRAGQDTWPCDGIDASSWPWWYHGYQFIHPRKLHMMFGRPETFNYVVVRGELKGRLRDGGSPQDPMAGKDVLSLRRPRRLQRRRLASAVQASSATVLRDGREGRVEEIHLYELRQGEPPSGPGRGILSRRGLAGWRRRCRRSAGTRWSPAIVRRSGALWSAARHALRKSGRGQ